MNSKPKIHKDENLKNKYYLETLFNSDKCGKYGKIFENKFSIIYLD